MAVMKHHCYFFLFLLSVMRSAAENEDQTQDSTLYGEDYVSSEAVTRCLYSDGNIGLVSSYLEITYHHMPSLYQNMSKNNGSNSDISDKTDSGSGNKRLSQDPELSLRNRDRFPTLHTCRIRIASVDTQLLFVELNSTGFHNCPGSNYIYLKDTRLRAWNDCPGTSLGRIKAADRPNFSLLFELLMDVEYPYTLVFTVQRAEMDIKLHYMSEVQGLVQSPPWPRDLLESPHFFSQVEIPVPDGHVIMISVAYLNIEYSRLDSLLAVFADKGTDHVWTASDNETPSPDVLNTTSITVVYSYPGHIDTTSAQSEFLLRFSFHKHQSVPQRLPDGKWDCAVAHWAEFRAHLQCNLDSECAGGQDEANCPFIDPTRCPPGHIALPSGCYLYVPDQNDISWIDAHAACSSRGKYKLVSLNTAKEWADILSVLSRRRDSRDVFVGLRSIPSVFPDIYGWAEWWTDRTIAYFFIIDQVWSRLAQGSKLCAYVVPATGGGARYTPCQLKHIHMDYICEADGDDSKTDSETRAGMDFVVQATSEERVGISFAVQSDTTSQTKFHAVECSGGHITHTFLACDPQSACWTDASFTSDAATMGAPLQSSCGANVTWYPGWFVCEDGLQRVPYSLVCDHRQDCADNSDEHFCVFPPCGGHTPVQCRGINQCVPVDALCDGNTNCMDKSDEEASRCRVGKPDVDIAPPPPPAVVHFRGSQEYVGYGYKGRTFSVIALDTKGNASATCPETHFQCPGDGYCLPVFLRCNDVFDCPGKDDEAGCEWATCPGFYRCRASRVCLHGSQVCDGTFQCPRQDDERYCDGMCPRHCTCHGFAFKCTRPFLAHEHQYLRYLEVADSGMNAGVLANNTRLVHVSLARCGLKHMDEVRLPNLLSLDLSDNELGEFGERHLKGLPQLRVLVLAGNPLSTKLFSYLQPASTRPFAPPRNPLSYPSPDNSQSFQTFPAVKAVDMSRVRLAVLVHTVFSLLPNLIQVNLSDTGLHTLKGQGFQRLKELRTLDLRGCPLTVFPSDMLQGLRMLRTVFADNYKVCCPAVLPAGCSQQAVWADNTPCSVPVCIAPTDELSSCQALLRSDVYRVLLSLLSILALTGNLTSWIIRLCVQKSGNKSGFGAFVTHLALADFVMGVYLAIIGLADRRYQGAYLWADTEWRQSAVCKMAGFLSLLSSEVSAIIVCWITLDRFLVLRFPFSSLHFRHRSAHLASAVTWLMGLLLATVPFLPVTSHWQFYSQTGICIPLPITKRSFGGKDYAFGIMIVLNLVLFLLIAGGQAVIFSSVRTNSLAAPNSGTTSQRQDISVARRLIAVVLTDFLCWFPIGCLGLLAANDVAIPGEVNVAMAILVLPLNSAINPFLYTLNIILEKRRRAKEQRLIRYITAQINCT